MRPRRMRLGCIGEVAMSIETTVASMRPRRMRLGCGVFFFFYPSAFSGFNEAEANAPRMRVTHTMAPHHNPSFNEAEANAPRMRDHSATIDRQRSAASMRPRRMRLGCDYFEDEEGKSVKFHGIGTPLWG